MNPLALAVAAIVALYFALAIAWLILDLWGYLRWPGHQPKAPRRLNPPERSRRPFLTLWRPSP